MGTGLQDSMEGIWDRVGEGGEVSESPLISFEEAGGLFGLHPNTIRQRKGGTETLTHVPGFGRRVFLVRSEVMGLLERKIQQAQANERKRREHLRLVPKAV